MHGGDTLAILSQSSTEEMARLIPHAADDTSLLTLSHEEDAKMFVQDRHVEAVFVLGGDERLLQTAERILGYAPDAKAIPLASTGGAAQALFERSPSTFDPDYRERFPGRSLMAELLDSLRSTPTASFV
jgi:hypothetical protein